MITAWHWYERSATEDAAPQDFGQIVVSTDRFRCFPEGWRVVHRRARALGPSFLLDAGAVLPKTGAAG